MLIIFLQIYIWSKKHINECRKSVSIIKYKLNFLRSTSALHEMEFSNDSLRVYIQYVNEKYEPISKIIKNTFPISIKVMNKIWLVSTCMC